MTKKKRYMNDDEELEYFQSQEFKDGICKIIEKDTWDKGLPKVYMNNKREIVEHWKDGTINVIKKLKDGKN